MDMEYEIFERFLTGYRYYHLIRVVLDSGIIELTGSNGTEREALTGKLGWNRAGAVRFIDCLCSLGILHAREKYILLSPFSRKYLLKKSAFSREKSILFEEKLMKNWENLEECLKQGQRIPPGEKGSTEYKKDLSLFLGAMDEAARIRAVELWDHVFPAKEGVIIDIGAGSGYYLFSFLEKYTGWKGIFCDMPDVITFARKNADASVLKRVRFVAVNLYDEESALPGDIKGDLLLLSNFVHCHGPDENRGILKKLLPALSNSGLIMIHDFFKNINPEGAFYDLHMLVNTYNGRTYSTGEIRELLYDSGVPAWRMIQLPSGSAVLAGAREEESLASLDKTGHIMEAARTLGFTEAKTIDAGEVPVSPRIREMCRKGCKYFSRKWSCPPEAFSHDTMKEFLEVYKRGIIVTGEPPLRNFQEKLLELERKARGEGFGKAYAFTAGHCTFCEECHPDKCIKPSKMRYSLEACGCEVFALTERNGIILPPVTKGMTDVTYVALLLLE